MVDARGAAATGNNAADVDMRKLEASFTARAIADEKETKKQLASLKQELKDDEDRLYHRMRVAVREGKSKVKKLLRKEVSAETALMAEKKAHRLQHELEQVKNSEAAKEKEIKAQLKGLKSEETSAIQEADPKILSKASSAPASAAAPQAAPSAGAGEERRQAAIKAKRSAFLRDDMKSADKSEEAAYGRERARAASTQHVAEHAHAKHASQAQEEKKAKAAAAAAAAEAKAAAKKKSAEEQKRKEIGAAAQKLADAREKAFEGAIPLPMPMCDALRLGRESGEREIVCA